MNHPTTYRSFLALFLGLLAFTTLNASAGAERRPEREQEMPLRIEAQLPASHRSLDAEQKSAPPLWIDIRTIALTKGGTLDLDQPVPFLPVPAGDEPITWRFYFRSHDPGPWASEEETAQLPRGCHTIRPDSDLSAPPADMDSASGAVLGTVVDRSYGYHGMTLGTLLRVEAQRSFGSAARTGRQAFFVFVPVGVFQVGNERICKLDPKYPSALPEVGQETVVLAHDPRGNDGEFLVGTAVTFRPDGAIDVAPRGNTAARKLSMRLPATKSEILSTLQRRFER